MTDISWSTRSGAAVDEPGNGVDEVEKWQRCSTERDAIRRDPGADAVPMTSAVNVLPGPTSRTSAMRISVTWRFR